MTVPPPGTNFAISMPLERGVSHVRNYSLDLARYPWILFADADDFLPERSIQRITELKREPPKSAFGFVVKSTKDGKT
jgi:cellulose synthase/poly-beta-1,6-N-acetylglucosamine synthase-like glycosyltransferase